MQLLDEWHYAIELAAATEYSFWVWNTPPLGETDPPRFPQRYVVLTMYPSSLNATISASSQLENRDL
jgi:hypothetical protein